MAITIGIVDGGTRRAVEVLEEIQLLSYLMEVKEVE